MDGYPEVLQSFSDGYPSSPAEKIMKKAQLIIFGGFAGAGKTTLANKLSVQFNYPYFGSDSINDALRPILGKNFQEVSPIAYDILWHLLRIQLSNNVTSILDMNMCHDRSWEAVDIIKKDFPQVEVLPIILTCSLETHKKRIRERGLNNKDHLNLGGESFTDTIHKYEYIKNLGRPDIIYLDTEESVEVVYNRLLDILA